MPVPTTSLMDKPQTVKRITIERSDNFIHLLYQTAANTFESIFEDYQFFRHLASVACYYRNFLEKSSSKLMKWQFDIKENWLVEVCNNGTFTICIGESNKRLPLDSEEVTFLLGMSGAVKVFDSESGKDQWVLQQPDHLPHIEISDWSGKYVTLNNP